MPYTNLLHLATPLVVHKGGGISSAQQAAAINDSGAHEEAHDAYNAPVVSHLVERLTDEIYVKETAEIGTSVDEGLRKLAWGGLPVRLRPDAWRLLLGYASPSRTRREKDLRRKRDEYGEYIATYHTVWADGMATAESAALEDKRGRIGLAAAKSSKIQPHESAILEQLAKDLPRHKLAVFHVPALVSRVERALFIWSLRYPAAGFVQGMDDLFIVFFLVFLAEAFAQAGVVVDPGDDGGVASIALATSQDVALLCAKAALLPDDALQVVEADSYWCAGRMLSWVQSYFVYGQPGLKRSLGQMESLLDAEDHDFMDSLAEQCVSINDFCIQWVHCLLVRELSPALAMRLWDTYLAIGDKLLQFHPFVCASLLLSLRPVLRDQPMDVVMRIVKEPAMVNPKANASPARHQSKGEKQQASVVREATSAAASNRWVPSTAWLDTIIAGAWLLKIRHEEKICAAQA